MHRSRQAACAQSRSACARCGEEHVSAACSTGCSGDTWHMRCRTGAAGKPEAARTDTAVSQHAKTLHPLLQRVAHALCQAAIKQHRAMCGGRFNQRRPHFCSALSTPSVRQRTTPAGMASCMLNSASSVSVTILMVSTTDLHGTHSVHGALAQQAAAAATPTDAPKMQHTPSAVWSAGGLAGPEAVHIESPLPRAVGSLLGGAVHILPTLTASRARAAWTLGSSPLKPGCGPSTLRAS